MSTWIGTAAGDGTDVYSAPEGIADGVATEVAVSHPSRVASDTEGNVYVASGSYHYLRKIGTDGRITMISGRGGSLNDGIPAINATLYWPTGLAVDLSGNIYVADSPSFEPRVRRIDVTTGIITTVAGNRQTGSSGDGGLAVNARVQPDDVALADDGTLYIADGTNHRVRKVTPDGWISTIAGTGTAGFSGDGGAATSARLNHPVGVAVDEGGNVYIAERNNHRVRKVNAATGIIETVAGTGVAGFSGDGGPATAAMLDEPTGVTISPLTQTLFIADTLNQRVRQVTTAGVISTVVGSGPPASGTYGGDGGPAGDARLSWPTGLTFRTGGDLFIADQGNHRVRQVIGLEGLCELIMGTVTTASGVPLPDAEVTSEDPSALDDCPAPIRAVSDSAGRFALFARKATGPLRRLTAVKAGYLDREVIHPLETTILMYQNASTWTDPGCEEDGNPLGHESQCIPPEDLSDPITTSGIDCEGTIYCDATMVEVQAMGHDTTELLVIEAMMAADETLDVVLEEFDDTDPLSPEASQAQSSQASSSPTGGVYFYLLPNRGQNCQYSRSWGGNCGYLIHFYWTGHSPTRFTWYPASSGTNNPAQQCVRNTGPVPVDVNGGKLRYKWGYMNGRFTGYESRSHSSFTPGLWRLDPWTVNCGPTTRGAFEIHGGDGGSHLMNGRTLGCIRLSPGGIRSLKSLWDHRTPNRQSGAALVAIDYSRV